MRALNGFELSTTRRPQHKLKHDMECKNKTTQTSMIKIAYQHLLIYNRETEHYNWKTTTTTIKKITYKIRRLITRTRISIDVLGFGMIGIIIGALHWYNVVLHSV